MNIKTENWQGYSIRFAEVNGEWWAVLKDICKALNLNSFDVSRRLDDSMKTKLTLDVSDMDSNHVRSRGENRSRVYLGVNELGIYEALFASRRPEAKQLRRWTATVLQRLRGHIGLAPYEVMRMTETEIQEDIDHFLDGLFYDEDTGKLMMSVTVQGGDVDQVEFRDQNLFDN